MHYNEIRYCGLIRLCDLMGYSLEFYIGEIFLIEIIISSMKYIVIHITKILDLNDTETLDMRKL